MAKPGSFELSRAGAKEIGNILNGDGMAEDLTQRGNRIAAGAGEGMEVSVQRGRTRIQASVYTATRSAAARERKRRALSRAVDLGR